MYTMYLLTPFPPPRWQKHQVFSLTEPCFNAPPHLTDDLSACHSEGFLRLKVTTKHQAIKHNKHTVLQHTTELLLKTPVLGIQPDVTTI